jgi:hypothetical protein
MLHRDVRTEGFHATVATVIKRHDALCNLTSLQTDAHGIGLCSPRLPANILASVQRLIARRNAFGLMRPTKSLFR